MVSHPLIVWLDASLSDASCAVAASSAEYFSRALRSDAGTIAGWVSWFGPRMHAIRCWPRATSCSSPSLQHVVEGEADLGLSHLLQPHPDRYLVECGGVREELAPHLQGEELQVTLYLFQHLGGFVLKEHLAAAALPPHVVHEVDRALHVGLLETDRVQVLVVIVHSASPPSASMLKTTGSVAL